MSTMSTAHSRVFCIRPHWKRRFLKLLPILLFLIISIIFAIKVHKKFSKLSRQIDELTPRVQMAQTSQASISYLTQQVDQLAYQLRVQTEAETMRSRELRTIQESYKRDVERLTLAMKQYEVMLGELNQKYLSLEKVNSELVRSLQREQEKNSAALMEMKAQMNERLDQVVLRKEMESMLEGFLTKEISKLLQVKESPVVDSSKKEEVRRTDSEEIHKKDNVVWSDPFDAEEIQEKDGVIIGDSSDEEVVPLIEMVEMMDTFDSFYRMKKDDAKSQRKTTYRMKVDPSDPFYVDENDDVTNIHEAYPNKVKDLINTSYRLTKDGLTTMKDFVEENGPKLVDEVKTASRKKLDDLNKYVEETIPKVSEKMEKLSKKTMEVGAKVKDEAEKFAAQAKKLTNSLFKMLRR